MHKFALLIASVGSLLLIAHSGAADGRTEVPILHMPAEFLGYWRPCSHSPLVANVGIDIKPDGIINSLFEKRDLQTRGVYKIIKIEQGKIFLIIQEKNTKSYQKLYPDLSTDPFYSYYTLFLERDAYLGYYRLIVKDLNLQGEFLNDADWTLPLSTHLERVNRLIDTYGGEGSKYVYCRN